MRRKVIQIAESTQLVSLPRKWCLSNNIKKGDELEVDAKGNSVTITTDRIPETKKCVLDITKLPKMKRRSICAAYLKGYDEIEIIYDKPEYIRVIQSILPEFTGYDIVQQEKNRCVIKQISKPTAEEFESVFNRLFLILNDALQTLIDGISKKDSEELKTIQFIEGSINKFSNFCRRIVNKEGYNPIDQNGALYFILTNLEFLGDEYKNLSQYLIEKKKMDKELIPILERIKILYDNVYRIFKTKDRQKAGENAVVYDELEEKVKNSFKAAKTDPILYYHVSRIMQIVIQIQEAILLLII